MTKQPAESIESTVRTLKTSVCPSLSGKSKLTYEIGHTDKGGIQFRVTANSAAGAFNPVWVTLKSIEAALDKVRNEPITGVSLMPLFRDMSCNTPYFILAVLKQEALVKPSTTSTRRYDRLDSADFLAAMQPLVEGKVPPQGVAKKNAVKKTAPAKTPSVSKKKSIRPS